MADETLQKLNSFFSKMEKHFSKQLVPIQDQIWDVEAIASYFKYDARYTRENIIKAPYFPPPCKLPTSSDGGRQVDLWRAKDVIQYALTFDKSTCKY